MYTDASGTLGYAAIFGTHWFAYPWVESMVPLGITIKELFPIFLALELWGKHLTNHKILFMSDNQAVVQVINKQSCYEPILMKLVRRLVLAALTNNIYFRSAHIPGKENVLADKLSRLKFQEALLMAPWLDQTTIALSLLAAANSNRTKSSYLRSWASGRIPGLKHYSVTTIYTCCGQLHNFPTFQ